MPKFECRSYFSTFKLGQPIFEWALQSNTQAGNGDELECHGIHLDLVMIFIRTYSELRFLLVGLYPAGLWRDINVVWSFKERKMLFCE